MMSAWMENVRGHPLYDLWRRHRERTLVGRVGRIIDECAGSAGAYSEAQTVAELRRLSATRCSLSPSVRTAVFGACDWEVHGLWPALGRIGTMEQFEYSRAVAPRVEPSSAVRSRLGMEFLKRIDRWAGMAPVNLVFIYAAGFWVDPSMLRELARRRIWTVLMGLDDKQQMPGPRVGNMVGWQLEAAQNVDLYWTTWRTGADWLAARGVRAWYAPEAADPGVFSPKTAERDIDVLWIGRGYGKRRALVRYLRSRGFEVEAHGPGWESGHVPFEGMLDLYARSKVVLGMGGVGPTEEIKHLKGRDFEAPMAGALYLTSYNPELADHFVIGRELLCYSSFVECADTLRWILGRPDVAQQIRNSARNRCVADHTWDARIRRIVDMLSGAPSARSQ